MKKQQMGRRVEVRRLEVNELMLGGVHGVYPRAFVDNSIKIPVGATCTVDFWIQPLEF